MTFTREIIDLIMERAACPVAVTRAEGRQLCGAEPDPTSTLGLCRRHSDVAARDLDRVLQRRLERLEVAAETKAVAEEREMREAVVYYLQRGDGLVKIGFSRRFPSRLAALTRDHGPLTLLAAHTGGRPAERHWHRRFATARVWGEWFTLTADLAEHIEAVGVPAGIRTRATA